MADWRAEARKAAQRHGLTGTDADVFVRQIGAESGFNPRAVSPAGARGIAQIMPGTAKGWGVNPDDPHAALDAAAKNMAGYLHKYGSWRDALTAYNAGPGRVGGALPRETRNYISKILGGSDRPAPTVPRQPAAQRTTVTGPAVSTSDALVQAMLSRRKTGGGLLTTAAAIQDAGGTTTSTVRQPVSPGRAPEASGGADLVAKLTSRANAINAKRLPYKWGGGHGGKVNAYNAEPLDCSGAVSAVLGINPRVSGQFTQWGKPGRGGRVTVYANDKHVLMEIDGKFFGTSASNPGGGAGWIPRAQVSKAYLSRFTARHI